MGRTEYNGKRGGNAGDEFHELWAARRALELIAPGSDLVELTVEGVRPDDSQGADEAVWDGVDAAFYYGPDVDRIERIELAQFKYSGSDPRSPWTVARLTHASNKAKSNSVIARLGSAWNAISARHPKLAADAAISVKLISNRPVATELIETLSATSEDSSQTKLREASGLSQRAFALFLNALNFADCGSESRFGHEQKVIETLSALKEGGIANEFALIKEFIRKRMLPESARDRITAESVYGVFGHADRRAFYPCPTKIAQADRLVPRAAVDEILARFARGSQKICLAGGGGEGKTTCLQDLTSRLPQGSEIVVYDCYDEGTYLNSDGYRHRPEDVFLQLSNEVAARLLLPPQLAEKGSNHPRRFARRLMAASDALLARDPAAQLVIAIDAADNSVTAAAQCAPPERSFVHDFALMGGLPANVRLLITARSGRLNKLELPDDVEIIHLGPFRENESRAFAESRLELLSPLWHAEFHKHSGGNPRVQRYAIDFANGSAERALEYLKPNGKTLQLIFQARMDSARSKVGSKTDLSRLCAALILLPRPVPLSYVAAVLEAEESHIRDLALDLAPGIVQLSGQLGFSDEDFEQFVRDAGHHRIPEVREAAATTLLAKHQLEAYACAHVAGLALQDGRLDQVVKLVREPIHDYPIADPAIRSEVHRRRLQTAMHACRQVGNAVDATALLLEGAQSIKTDEALDNTLLSNIELAVNFSRDKLVRLVLKDPERRHLQGAFLLQTAGIDGLRNNAVEMRSHFRSFLAWQDARSEALKQFDETTDGVSSARDTARRLRGQRHVREDDWDIDPDDVAAMIIGQLHADQCKDARRWLARPRGPGFRRKVLRNVIRRLIRLGDIKFLQRLSDNLPARHPGQVMIAFGLAIAGQPIDSASMRRWVQRVGSSRLWTLGRADFEHTPDDEDAEDARHLLDACDLLLINKSDRAEVHQILSLAMPSSARTLTALTGYDARKTDFAARAFALSKVILGEPVKYEDFLVAEPPPATKPAKKSKRSRASAQKPSTGDVESKNRKAQERYKSILTMHELRAKILVGETAPADAAQAIAGAITRHAAADSYLWRRDEKRPRDRELYRAFLVIGAVPGVDAASIFKSLADGLGHPSELLGFQYLALLEHASAIPPFRPAIVDLAIAICDQESAVKSSARDKISNLTALARLVLPLDVNAAAYCFNAALRVAGDVDYDSLQGIEITSGMAQRSRGGVGAAEAKGVALRLAAVDQEVAIRLSDAENFPWSAIATSLASLAPEVALAAASRFAELNLTSGRSFLASVLKQCLTDESLDDETVCAFLPILGRSGGEVAEELLLRAGRRDSGALAEEVIRHLSFESCGSTANQIAAISKLRSPGPRTRHFQASVALKASLSPAADYQHSVSARSLSADVQALDSSLLNVSNINDVASFLARVDQIESSTESRFQIRRAIATQLLARVPTFRIGDFLDILVGIPEGDDVVSDLGRLLIGQLEIWGSSVAATTWANANILRVIEARLPEFAWNLDYGTPDFVRIINLSGAPSNVIAQRLLKAIEQHIGALGATSVYRLVGILTQYLSPQEAFGVLGRHVEAMRALISPNDRALPGFDTIQDIPTSVARAIYAEMAYVSHDERWRAAHAVRVLARLNKQADIERLCERYECETEPAFSHPTAPFYFLAARLWLMVSLARAAWESGSAVIPLRDWLFRNAERTDFPHFLIRDAAKTALNGLVHASPEEFSASDRARIAAINASPFSPSKSTQKSWDKGFAKYGEVPGGKRRFRFDTMDTLPSWYSSALRVFSDPVPSEFLDISEHWIVERLGVNSAPYEFDKMRGNDRFNRYDLGSGSNRDGALPAIERYRTYLEWHAMYLATGVVLAKWPLEAADEDDAWSSFAAWSARQRVTLSPVWLSDLREEKPLDPIAWHAPEKTTWVRQPSVQDIRGTLGLDLSEWLIVGSQQTIQHGDLRGSTHSESAFVSPVTATSLRVALHQYENSFHYRLAGDSSDDDQIVEGSFVLSPLIVDGSSEVELDIHDPFRGEVRAPEYLPHPKVVTKLGLIKDPLGFPVWRDQSGIDAIKAISWSDPRRRGQGWDREFAHGESLLIRRSVLSRLLVMMNQDLIVEVVFKRQIGESSYEKKVDKKREREFRHFCIFRQDGSIETRTRGIGRWS